MKTVIITGGHGDIANSIKDILVNKGYTVFAPSKEEMDVTNYGCVNDYMSKVKPDILINNAGYVVPGSVKTSDEERIKRHIDINLLGVFYCANIVLKQNADASIINIGSAASVETHSTWSEYCATKAGVVMATKCWADDGIYSVCISPGRTRTKMRKSLFPDEDQNTLLEPGDFAKVVLKAVEREYEAGSHIVVRKQNVKELLNE